MMSAAYVGNEPTGFERYRDQYPTKTCFFPTSERQMHFKLRRAELWQREAASAAFCQRRKHSVDFHFANTNYMQDELTAS